MSAFPSRQHKPGFTLIELLVVISIMTLLISLLLPVLSKAREAGKSIKCSTQLKNVGLAMQMYLNNNKEVFPRDFAWFSMTSGVGAYLDLPATGQARTTVYTCPTADGRWSPRGWVFHRTFTSNRDVSYNNRMATRLSDVKYISELAFVMDGLPGTAPAAPNGYYYTEAYYLISDANRNAFATRGVPHNQARNVVYVDGHVGAVDAAGFLPGGDLSLRGNRFWAGGAVWK